MPAISLRTGRVANVGRNETYLKQEIMANGPVTVAFTVYSDFENYAGGIYHHVKGTMAGGHAVKFVGWGVENGVKYWKVANSWNPHWGEGGYFRIAPGQGGIDDRVIRARVRVRVRVRVRRHRRPGDRLS